MPLSQPTLTVAEQVVAAELAYYRQIERYVITEADLATWQAKQALFESKQPLTGTTYSFMRHVLERHHHSLHTYMARQLSVEAWTYWFRQGGIVAP